MEPQVVITLPPNASAELIARVTAAFPGARLADPAAEIVPDQTEALEAAITDAVTDVPRLGGMLESWWATLPLGGWGLLAVMAAIILGVYAVEMAAARLVRFDPGSEPRPSLTERLPRGLLWLLWRFALVGAFGVCATALFAVIMRPDPTVANLFRGLLAVVIAVRIRLLIIEAIVGPEAPRRRLMGIDADGAMAVYRASRWLGAGLLITGAMNAVLYAVSGEGAAAHLPRIALMVAGNVIGAWFFLHVSGPIRDVLLRAFGPERAATSRAIGILVRHWAWLYVVLLVVDAMMRSAGILGLLGTQATGGAGRAILILVLAPLGVAAIRVWGNESAERAAAAGTPRGGVFFGTLALVEGAFQLGVVILLLRAWGIDPANPPTTGIGQLVPRMVEAAGMVVLGFAIWKAVGAFLTPRAERPEEKLDDEERGSRRRLATILPVLRGVALAGVGVLTAMTALSALGVNIAPLLASAGVLGLAIGFGAQRLVADVISGVLYLYEDAFRIGEYIEVTGGKGSVERISLRSVRLRHPRGPVFTIPFSGMGTVQNHSRDFATMKFSFAVHAGTDLEKVRKLVKKAGEKMLEDPEMKAAIIEPLKSQGAVSIQGASYQIGIKFTAKPGKQFAVRRQAFIAVSKALEENGIELFAPQLTINPQNPAGPLVPMDNAPGGGATPPAAG